MGDGDKQESQPEQKRPDDELPDRKRDLGTVSEPKPDEQASQDDDGPKQ